MKKPTGRHFESLKNVSGFLRDGCVRLLSEQDLGDVFEEREGGAVPTGRFRSAGFDSGEDLAELGV
jgi:hypothetical protein